MWLKQNLEHLAANLIRDGHGTDEMKPKLTLRFLVFSLFQNNRIIFWEFQKNMPLFLCAFVFICFSFHCTRTLVGLFNLEIHVFKSGTHFHIQVNFLPYFALFSLSEILVCQIFGLPDFLILCAFCELLNVRILTKIASMFSSKSF